VISLDATISGAEGLTTCNKVWEAWHSLGRRITPAIVGSSNGSVDDLERTQQEDISGRAQRHTLTKNRNGFIHNTMGKGSISNSKKIL
jgi:hypothetical protein